MKQKRAKTKPPKPSADPSTPSARRVLRQQAEAQLRKQPADRDTLRVAPEAARHLLHELEVHQIELEMQNEELRRAQEELEAARSKYFDLYDLAPVGYLTLSEQGLVLEANLTTAKLLGVEKRQLVKKPVTRFIVREDQDIYYLRHKQLAETRAPQVCEFRMVRKGGVAFWVHLEAIAAQDADGAPVCRATLSDITARKRAEETLRESEERYRQLFDAESDAIFLIDNTTGRILEASRAASAVYGYSREELLSKKNSDLSAEPEETQQVTQETPISPDQVVTIPLRYHRKKDSTVFPVEITGRFFIRQGHPVHIAAIRDITARKQTEEALRESEERFRKLFEDHFAVMLIIDPDTGNIIAANKAAANFYGWAIEDLGQMRIQQINTLSAEAVKSEMEQARSSERSVFEFRHRRADGSIRDVEVFSNKIEIAGKDLLYSIIHDITARKQVEEELHHAKASVEEAHRELQQMFAREQHLARTDALTGVNNHRYWFELAEHEFEVATRYRHPLSAIMFDIDHFKLVNDTFGHAVGDQMLERVAQVARAALRSADVIGRYGGEEFVIVLPMTNAQQAYPVAERVRAGVAAIRVETANGQAAVTLSIGIADTLPAPPAERPGGDASVETVIRRADKAMYAAKVAGRNQTSIYSAPAERPGGSA